MSMSEIFDRILVALSGTESSQAAAALAFRLAQFHGAHVVVVNVVDTGLAQEIARVLGRPENEVLAEMEATSRSYLHHGELLARRAGVSAETVVRRGVPHLEIIAQAEASQADLVVLGSTHLEGPRRLAIGRVVERVMEHADRPVLVVPRRAQT